MSYSILDYDAMLADGVRSRAYLDAIAAAVKPGDVVVEIGTGVGFFAVAACRAGARRVYAIETNAAIAIAPEVLAANDCADRVILLRGDSRRVTVDELGDVLLEDMRGVLPLHGQRISSIIDARARLLHHDARFITRRDTLFAAPVAADEKFLAAHIAPGDAPFGIDRRPLVSRVRQDWQRTHLDGNALFAPPAQLMTLDYATITSADVEGSASWIIERDGTVDGISVWFDAELGGDVRFSNSPFAPRAIYGQAFFPLARSLAVRAGDRLKTDFRAKPIDGSYLFAWDTEHVAADGSRTSFRQSNLSSITMSMDELHRRSADFTPTSGPAQRRLGTLLSLVDGRRSLDEITELMFVAYPEQFSCRSEARSFVSATLGRLADEDGDGTISGAPHS